MYFHMVFYKYNIYVAYIHLSIYLSIYIYIQVPIVLVLGSVFHNREPRRWWQNVAIFRLRLWG